jgi:hypothetical protein
MFSLFNLINFFCRFIDTPENGGLSGATLEEAKSWGKIGAKAKAVTAYCDATIALPVTVAVVRERIARWQQRKILFSFIFFINPCHYKNNKSHYSHEKCKKKGIYHFWE